MKTDREPLNLPEAIRSVHAGKHHHSSSIRDVLLSEEGVPPYFSNQEIQVLQRVANGLLLKTIADQLALPAKKISAIMKSIYQKMEIDLNPAIVPEIVMINKARKMDLLLTEPF